MVRTASLAVTLAFGSLAFSQTAQVPPTQPGVGAKGSFNGPIQQTPWFNDATVRGQLKLNDNQANQLNRAYSDTWTNYQKGIGLLGKNLSEEQRLQQIRNLQNQFYSDLYTNSNKIITDPQQQQRFNQLGMQFRGIDAFFDPMVQDKLKLTPQQQQKINEQRDLWVKSMGELQSTYSKDKTSATKKYNELRQQERDRLNAILTPEQQKTWSQIVGQGYDFPPSAYFSSSSTGKSGG